MTQEASHPKGSPAGRRLTPAERRWRGDGSGIGFRLKAKGRTYGYWAEDLKRYVSVGPRRKDAVAAQAEYRSRKARGERVVVPSGRTVREVGEAWYEAEHGRWRPEYAREQRRNLEKEIFEEFGSWKIAAIGPQDLLAYDRKLRERGLSESGAANVQKPLRGLLDHAVLCNDIAVSPFRQVPMIQKVSKRSRVVSGPEEDLLRDFGSALLSIGFPVRPAKDDQSSDEPPADDGEQPDGDEV